MFGYVIPDKENMYIKDFNVFQGYYCGLCRALGKTGGPMTRLCTSYDVTFYSVLLHSIAGVDPKIERKVCGLNCKKKPMVEVDDLSLKSADVAVLLTYYNVADDIEDGKRSRLPIKWRLNLRKKAASKRMPEVDKLLKREFGRLSKLEKENSDSIDMVADCTAVVMRDMTRLLVETDENIDLFTYNLGRLIYLLDAVDDVLEDSKKGRYNVIVNNFGKCEDKAEYLEKNQEELGFLLRSTYNRMVESYNKMDIKVGEGVLSNTIYLGLNLQIERLLKGVEKCHTIRL
ncbi:MAG: hypothetical protein IKD35_04565 [Clostridia bacterium]|nr:hypothetical protein [Clostridia bacterium]